MKKFISLFSAVVLFASAAVPHGCAAAAANEPSIVSLDCSNDAGDYTYFDSSYCHTSGAARYNNFSSVSGNNYMELYRLDYKNPKHKNFIYAERTDKTSLCYFDVTLKRSSMTRYPDRTYDYILVESDVWTTVGGCEAQLFYLRDLTSSMGAVTTCVAVLGADGAFTFSDGTRSAVLFQERKRINLKIAVDLPNHSADIYVDGMKIKSGLALPQTMNRIGAVRFRLMEGATGNMYLDNFRIKGMVNPYVNGKETPTSIYPTDEKLVEFMQGKVGFHAYGGLMYKNGAKTKIEYIYDRENSEMYLLPDTLQAAFGIGKVSVTGSTAVSVSGRAYSISGEVRTEGGKSYIPLTSFAKDVLGKFVFSFKTGFFIVSDKNEVLDTSSWTYQAFRTDSSQMTLWNDIDFLNNFLQFERPDAARLKNDFAAASASAHPRLLLDKDDFDYLRSARENDADYKKISDRMISTAKGYAKRAVLTYKYDDAMRTLSTANEMMARFLTWGYAYNITGDKFYADRAYTEIIAASKFPDINTSHIIDAGTYVMAFAIAYDWFYEAFTPTQRENARALCMDKGLKVLAGGIYGGITSTSSGSNMFGSFRWGTNYNSIVVGGTLNAAVALLDTDEDYCLDIIKNCLRGYEYSLAELMPNGGWNESPSYWNYAMEFSNFGFATLDTAFGTDYGMTDAMGVSDSLRFAMANYGADGLYNYHDSGASKNNSSDGFMYMSKKFGIKEAFDMRIYDITDGGTVPSILDAIYYDSRVFGTSSDKIPPVNYIEGAELFTVRDTYKRSDSKFYFGTHFGTTSGYHQHYDCGSFVLDIDGTRFAEDLGPENYNLQNELGYTDTDLYRKRAEGHNVFVFNPSKYVKTAEQLKGKFVPVATHGYDDSSAYVTADLSDVYADVGDMNIGYHVDRVAQSVTMNSEFVPIEDGTEVYWFMHTKADIETAGNTAVLTRLGKKIKLEFETNAADAQIMSMDAVPLPTSPQVPEQNENRGYSKVAIKLTASGRTNLTVKISKAD